MDHPLLNAFWMMLWFFLWIMWLFLLFKIVMDIFRSHDMGGWGKAGWLIFVILLPFLGVLVYLIARGGAMGERDMQEATRREKAMQEYIRETAGSGGGGGSNVDQLTKLADLKARGELTQEEFDRAKEKLLAG
ncbi:SHOCT domain-containing protein [Kitasatospora sp. NPDC058965]|uniref:SHOCT domain-containing protein n=1 Tax=Kitasatospora sp. NPDC058965 TaxID=3346682 RepID=UPI0036818A64